MPDRILLPLIVACALFMENLDSTVLATALPAIAKDFGASPIHLKLALTDGLGGKLEAICFGAFDTDLGPALANHGGARFHIAGRLELNHWNGRVTAQLRLEDAAPA